MEDKTRLTGFVHTGGGGEMASEGAKKKKNDLSPFLNAKDFKRNFLIYPSTSTGNQNHTQTPKTNKPKKRLPYIPKISTSCMKLALWHKL